MRLAWLNFVSLFYYSVYFFLLFMGPITFFGTIYRFHCTISTNFYLYLQYFQQKVFSFSKISGFQIDHLNNIIQFLLKIIFYLM